MSLFDNPNWTGAAVAAVITSAAAIWVAFTKVRQDKVLASYNVAPSIITNQNQRIKELEDQLDTVRDRQNVREQVLRTELDKAWESRDECRRELNTVTQEIREMRWQLQQAGIIPLPPRIPEDNKD